jgi:hypothetical protein
MYFHGVYFGSQHEIWSKQHNGKVSHLLWNARTFNRWVVQWYFADWAALDEDNARIWNSYYRPKPLFDHLPTWQDWLPEYRQLIIEVQEMVDEHKAQGTWKKPA